MQLSGIAEKFRKKRAAAKDFEDEHIMTNILFDSVKELYLKYIQADTAPLEINVSSRTRANIESVFEHETSAVTADKILDVMEVAVEEILSVLTGSAMRYSPEDVEMKRGHFHVQTMTGHDDRAGWRM